MIPMEQPACLFCKQEYSLIRSVMEVTYICQQNNVFPFLQKEQVVYKLLKCSLFYQQQSDISSQEVFFLWCFGFF